MYIDFLKTFTQALTDLALHPEYLEPLRREAEAAFRNKGLTQAAMNDLPYLDSFFKESMRMHSLGSSKCKETNTFFKWQLILNSGLSTKGIERIRFFRRYPCVQGVVRVSSLCSTS